MTNLDIGIVTIIVGVIAAITNIFVTFYSNNRTAKISRNALKQQQLSFLYTQKINYLTQKKEFLESRIDESDFESVKKDDGKPSDTMIILSLDWMIKLSRIIEKSSHYLDTKDVTQVVGFGKKIAELIAIGKLKSEGADVKESVEQYDLKDHFNDLLNQLPEQMDFCGKILRIELKRTIEQIEEIINAT